MSRRKKGTVESVNVGGVREIPRGKRVTRTAIWKQPVEGRVPISGVHVGDDVQADRRYHGGYDKAVYAYAREDYEWWEREIGRELVAGNFGENLTLRGIDVSGAVIGERWRIGTAVLEVSEPRTPCRKLGLRMDDPKFPKLFAAANLPGTYLRIIEEGGVAAGDEVTVASRPAHGVTSALVFEAVLSDHSLAPRLLEAPELPEALRTWAFERAEAA